MDVWRVAHEGRGVWYKCLLHHTLGDSAQPWASKQGSAPVCARARAKTHRNESPAARRPAPPARVPPCTQTTRHEPKPPPPKRGDKSAYRNKKPDLTGVSDRVKKAISDAGANPDLAVAASWHTDAGTMRRTERDGKANSGSSGRRLIGRVIISGSDSRSGLIISQPQPQPGGAPGSASFECHSHTHTAGAC